MDRFKLQHPDIPEHYYGRLAKEAPSGNPVSEKEKAVMDLTNAPHATIESNGGIVPLILTSIL